MNEEHDVLISRYLAADMGPPELEAFEARIVAEPELAAALQQRQEEQQRQILRQQAAADELASALGRVLGEAGGALLPSRAPNKLSLLV